MVNPISSVTSQTTYSSADSKKQVIKEDSNHVNEQARTKSADRQNEELSIGDKQKKKMIEDALKALEPKVKAEVEYMDNSNRLIIKLRDADTDDIIREIPPEETRKLIEKLNEVKGLLIDEKV